MGLFKQVKDMKSMVAAAPDMIAQGAELAANAQAMAAAQQQAAMQMTAPMGTATALASEADLSPIAGVSLELYAEISQSLAEVGYDQSRAPEMAARKGVVAADWDAAVAGWNARMQTNPTVGQRFHALYTGR
jgi:hypothetical protein